MKPSYLRHALKGSWPVGNVVKHFPDEVAQEHKVEARRDAGQDDEAEGQVGAQLCHPDWEEWVLQLDSALTHVEHKQAETAEEDDRQVLPVRRKSIRFSNALQEVIYLNGTLKHSLKGASVQGNIILKIICKQVLR